MIKTDSTNYGEIKGYGCTILPYLFTDEITNMYASAYSESKELPIKIMYLNNRKSHNSNVRGYPKTH